MIKILYVLGFYIYTNHMIFLLPEPAMGSCTDRQTDPLPQNEPTYVKN